MNVGMRDRQKCQKEKEGITFEKSETSGIDLLSMRAICLGGSLSSIGIFI